VTALGLSFDQRTSYIVLKTCWYFYLFLALGYNDDSTVPNLPDIVTCISILACTLFRASVDSRIENTFHFLGSVILMKNELHQVKYCWLVFTVVHKP